MKSFKFLRTVPGIATSTAIIAVSGVGVYALSNWFGGDVPVPQQSNGVFSVDLSSCTGNLPVGIEPIDDRHDIQFKITGEPHISAQALQQEMLTECEHNAVVSFYSKKFSDLGNKHVMYSGKIDAVHTNGALTISSTEGPKFSFKTGTFTLSADATFYDQGQLSSLVNLHVGDTVQFVAYSPSHVVMEGSDVITEPDVQVVSVFKTKYDDGTMTNFSYEANNILPLDVYNQLPNHKLYP